MHGIYYRAQTIGAIFNMKQHLHISVCVCVFYHVCGPSHSEQSQAEVKVLVDDEVAQVGRQHDPTNTQQVWDGPWVLVLR